MRYLLIAVILVLCMAEAYMVGDAYQHDRLGVASAALAGLLCLLVLFIAAVMDTMHTFRR